MVPAPAPNGILDEEGRLFPDVAAARRRGVIFDLGNGVNGHFSWDVLERATKQGFWPDTLFVRYRSRTGANTMSASIRIAAAAVLIVPALGSAEPLLSVGPRAESQKQWTANAMSYAAANKSRRATRSAPRGRVSQATDSSVHIIAPDGRDLGTDPDAAIRFQLRRDPGASGGSGGGM
jgi:hypothetical protein